MPSETFYKLPDEKRNNILNAIKKEFTAASIEDISVNRIVEESKIAKGSFYQYFKDKNDAITYILKQFIFAKKQEIKEIISLNNGDVFKSAIIVFDNMVSNRKNEGNINFVKNVVRGVAAKGIKLIDIKNKTGIDSYDNSILECIDISKYNIIEIVEIKAMMELIIRSLSAAVIGVFNNIDKYEELKKQLIIELEIIRCGVMREEDKC